MLSFMHDAGVQDWHGFELPVSQNNLHWRFLEEILFLTIVPGVPNDISGRSVTRNVSSRQLTPQSYVPSVTQPSTNGFAVQEYFDSEPAIL